VSKQTKRKNRTKTSRWKEVRVKGQSTTETNAVRASTIKIEGKIDDIANNNNNNNKSLYNYNNKIYYNDKVIYIFTYIYYSKYG